MSSKKSSKYEKFPSITLKLNETGNQLLNNSFNKDYELYRKIGLFYGIKNTNNSNKKSFITNIKKKIEGTVLGSKDNTVYQHYIDKKLPLTNRRLLNHFLNNITFRNKINTSLKEIYSLETVKSSLKPKKTKKNKFKSKDKICCKSSGMKTKLAHQCNGNNIQVDMQKCHPDKSSNSESIRMTKIISNSPILPQKNITVFKSISKEIGLKLWDEKNNEGLTLIDKTISICHYKPLENFDNNSITLRILITNKNKCLIVCPKNGKIYKDCEILIPPNKSIIIKKKTKINYENIKNHIIYDAILE